MSARNMEVLIFKRGRVVRRMNLRAVDNLLMDKKGRRAYIIGSSAVPEFRRSFGFPTRGRVFMLHELVTDVMPLETEKVKRTDRRDTEDLEDLGLYREMQRLKSGDSEPQHARWLGYGVAAMVAGVLLVGSLTVFDWMQVQGYF